MADKPKPYSELEDRLYDLPGESWALSHVLASDDRVGNNLSKMVFMAQGSFNERSHNPEAVHQMMIGLLHEIFGNPFHLVSLKPDWLTPTVKEMAQKIYDDRTFDKLLLLADELVKSGCTNQEILGHCRGSGPHVRGCWVVDGVLGKK